MAHVVADLPPAAGLNKSQKFVRIVEALQRPDGVRVDELQQHFELDDRTLRRYLKDLRALELPIRSEGRGGERRLWMAASYRRQRVQVSLLELISLKFGRSAFRFLEGTGFAEDMDEALEALSSVAGTHARDAGDLDRKFIAVPEHRKDHTRDADLIDNVLTAVVRQNPADAFYAKVGGTTKRYHLEPLTLAIYKQGLYLFARDVAAGFIKTFAIDRFRSFQRRKGERFDYPADYDPLALTKNAFGIIGGPVEAVSLRFHRRVAPYIQEREWHHSQELERTEDGGLRLHMIVGPSAELVSWVMSFGPDVRVEAPESLRKQVRRLHAEAARDDGFSPTWGRR